MKKINIHNEANIKGNGVHTYPNAKPVICIEDGTVFTSVMDAAEAAGVYHTTMVGHLKGRTKACNGKRYCYLSNATESLDAIVSRLREISTMEKDARKWREQEEAKEAARLAKEKRQDDIAKLMAKIAKHEENCLKLEAKLTEEEKCLLQARCELTKLLAEDEQSVA